MSAKRIMLVAAEPSGDVLGAGLADALRERLGEDLELIGVGGPMMATRGVASPFDIRALSVLGVFEAIAAYPLVRRRARETGAMAASRRPDVAVLIDSWGFTLRVAAAIRRMDPTIPIIKYVAPQVWATRPGRAKTLARAVDELLTIHAFDSAYFDRVGLKTRFVGNPVLAKDISGADPGRLRAQIGARDGEPILLVLPGSRRGEIERMTPPFRSASERLARDRPDLHVVVAAAEAVETLVEERCAGWAARVHIVRGEAARFDAMKAATVALACSGTVTTELAMCGCPMVIAYRLGPMTYPIVKLLLRTPYIALINVAVGRFVAPERLQGDCNGETLARDLAERLDDPTLRSTQIAAQNAALEIMRGGLTDPLGAAADAIIRHLTNSQSRVSSGV